MAGLAAIEALRAHARDLQPRKRPRPIVAYQGRGQLISDDSDRADYCRAIQLPRYVFRVKRGLRTCSRLRAFILSTLCQKPTHVGLGRT